ncbi:MAG: hypothetical protein KKF48_00180 [Nanoarchaeota archaeon]|nr:hypothetical protein [Nanoarchaeota archaeon]MBU1027441.1 hypothetical protein [Nanoarchaeota archaeon]
MNAHNLPLDMFDNYGFIKETELRLSIYSENDQTIRVPEVKFSRSAKSNLPTLNLTIGSFQKGYRISICSTPSDEKLNYLTNIIPFNKLKEEVANYMAKIEL